MVQELVMGHTCVTCSNAESRSHLMTRFFPAIRREYHSHIPSFGSLQSFPAACPGACEPGPQCLQKRNISFSESDLSSDGKVLEEFGSLSSQWEERKVLSREAAAEQSKGAGNPAASQREWPHCPHRLDSEDPSKLDAQNLFSNSGRLESHPVKHIVCLSHSIPDTQNQTSSSVSDTEQNLPDWAAEILNTYLEKVESTGQRFCCLPGSAESAVNSSAPVLEGDCEPLSTLQSQPPDQTTPRVTKTRFDIIITLAREEGCGQAGAHGHAGGLVSAEAGDRERPQSSKVLMAENGTSNPSKPAERVAVECQRNAPKAWEPPLAGSAGRQAQGGEPSIHLQRYVLPRLGCRDPGFSRFLPKSSAVQTDRKPDLQKLASLPEPLRQVGGSVVNSNKGEGDSSIMSTNSKIDPETDQHPSSHVPSQPADNPNFTHTINSTAQQDINGGLGDSESGNSEQTNSSLQPSKRDLKYKVYNVFIKDERFVNGSDPTTTNENTSQKVLSSSDSPTLSEGVGNQSTMNSLICIGTIGGEPSQQSGKDPRCDESDAWKNVTSSGSTQQINTLHQQTPDQNGHVAEVVTSPNDKESVPSKIKLDSVSQLVESSLINLQEPLQNVVNFPTDSMKVQATETPTLSLQSMLLQKPMENLEDIKVESSSMVNPEPQGPAAKFTCENTGPEGNSGQQLHLSRSPLLENHPSFNDVFIENNLKKKLTNATDDPDSQSEIDGFVDTIRNLEVPMFLSRNKNSRIQRSHALTSPISTLPPIEEDQTNPKHSPSSSIIEEPPEPVAVDGKLLPNSPSESVSELPQMDFSKTLTKKEILTPGQMMKMQFEEKPKIGIQCASAENSIVFQSSFSRRTNLEYTANLEGTEALSGDSNRSRISSSFLYSTYGKPTESFSSRSLDLSQGSVTKNQSSAPPTMFQNSVQRSLSQENVATTIMAGDKLSTLNLFAHSANESLYTRRASLPLSISERLIPGYSCLSDSGHDLPKHRISLPPERKPGKLTAFPEGWNSKPKEQGKINPRPGKIVIYDKPNFSGFKREISCDVSDCSSWPFPATISIKVIRGCWVMYEKPNYKGKKIFLVEEDVELMNPWAEEQEEETEDQDSKPPSTKPTVIGSLRRAVRDYTIPQISLFPDANGEGKKLSFYGGSEDIRIFGYPPKTTSIIVNSGLWLVYSEPFFEGQQCALEVGGYRTLQEWGAEKAQVGSLITLQMSGPRVEKPYEPKLIIFEKAYYVGRSREVHGDSSDFLSRYPNNGAPLSNAGSIKVYGGIWVGYSKEGFRGHQYLLEEGEYLDWRSWGGSDEDLKSLRVIRADFSNPMIILYPGNNCEGENSTTAIDSVPDLEETNSGDLIQYINVLSGTWVAYEGANYSGAQYILEKGVYRNPQDWGAQSCKISSLHPILLVEPSSQQFRLKIQIFSEYDFNGHCLVIEENKMGIPKDFKLQSCRVLSGSWALYEGQEYNGRVFVVSEGEYPDLQSMGCRMTTHIRCVKAIPHVFSQPLITLHSLENFEGKEIELESEEKNLISEGYNNQVLSLHVLGGVWVIYEYSNFRGRQVLLEPIEISNWPKYSSFTRIGSLMPVIQKRRFFNIRNKETDGLLSVILCEEDIKSGRVIVAPENKELEQLWFYEKGLLKPKFAPDMSLQTIGIVGDTGSKVVIWSETRLPKHCWTFEFSGTIRSLLYEGFVLDIKGGKSYDQDSAMICKHEEQNPVQQWEIQML
ncbi:beta/gamma crystallin domain-containing protein 2-like [Pristis pectinata]|uniref:beta/gamma crystallin domain-containing protein 2-like n=1 Tax=Pristis pectinata TaxID=685728 RepID=UPI00223CAEAC|nr:beta/gamma crystallin domain-containing protein 2-like [Pristis pectinata]